MTATMLHYDDHNSFEDAEYYHTLGEGYQHDTLAHVTPPQEHLAPFSPFSSDSFQFASPTASLHGDPFINHEGLVFEVGTYIDPSAVHFSDAASPSGMSMNDAFQRLEVDTHYVQPQSYSGPQGSSWMSLSMPGTGPYGIEHVGIWTSFDTISPIADYENVFDSPSSPGESMYSQFEASGTYIKPEDVAMSPHPSHSHPAGTPCSSADGHEVFYSSSNSPEWSSSCATKDEKVSRPVVTRSSRRAAKTKQTSTRIVCPHPDCAGNRQRSYRRQEHLERHLNTQHFFKGGLVCPIDGCTTNSAEVMRKKKPGQAIRKDNLDQHLPSHVMDGKTKRRRNDNYTLEQVSAYIQHLPDAKKHDDRMHREVMKRRLVTLLKTKLHVRKEFDSLQKKQVKEVVDKHLENWRAQTDAGKERMIAMLAKMLLRAEVFPDRAPFASRL